VQPDSANTTETNASAIAARMIASSVATVTYNQPSVLSDRFASRIPQPQSTRATADIVKAAECARRGPDASYQFGPHEQPPAFGYIEKSDWIMEAALPRVPRSGCPPNGNAREQCRHSDPHLFSAPGDLLK